MIDPVLEISDYELLNVVGQTDGGVVWKLVTWIRDLRMIQMKTKGQWVQLIANIHMFPDRKSFPVSAHDLSTKIVSINFHDKNIFSWWLLTI